MEEIFIKDPAFEALVRKKLKKETGAITHEDMAKIDKFNGRIVISPFPEKVILDDYYGEDFGAAADISGIEHCVNMEVLSIKAEISNGCAESVAMLIENIIKLKSLKHLHIEGDAIKHIDWVSELPSLETLHMINMDIREPKTLGKLSRLIDIFVAESKLDGVDWIYKAEKLKNLTLSDVSMPEELSLGGLKELRHFSVKSDNIRKITLYDMPKLEWAGVKLEKVDNIRTIENLTTLTCLLLTADHKTDITPLLALKELKRLKIDKNTIDDLEVIQQMHWLEELNIWGNTISDLSPLLNMPNLKTVSLAHCIIDDIETLQKLSTHCAVSLYKNQTPSGEAIDNNILSVF